MALTVAAASAQAMGAALGPQTRHTEALGAGGVISRLSTRSRQAV